MSGRCCCGSVWKARSLAGIEVIAQNRYEGTAALTSGVRSITLARHDERPPCDISINDYRLQYSTVHMISRELAQSSHSPQHPAFDVFRNATSLDLPSGRGCPRDWSMELRSTCEYPLLLEVLSILEAMYSSGPDFCYETLSQSQSMLLWCAIVARLVNREISLSALPSEESAMLFLHGRLLSVLPRGASSATPWWWYVCAHLLVTENRGSRMAAATWQEPQFRR